MSENEVKSDVETDEIKSDVETGKGCAILAYILIGIVWYFVDEKMRKNSFAKFHVKQGLVLLITSLIISVAGSIIPIIGWFVLFPIGQLFILVLLIMGIVNAINGNEKALPIIGQFGEKFNL